MLRLIYCALTLGVLSMTGCRSGRPVVGTSDDRATVPVIPVAPDSDMLSAAIADTENEVCPADSGDPFGASATVSAECGAGGFRLDK